MLVLHLCSKACLRIFEPCHGPQVGFIASTVDAVTHLSAQQTQRHNTYQTEKSNDTEQCKDGIQHAAIQSLLTHIPQNINVPDSAPFRILPFILCLTETLLIVVVMLGSHA